MKTRAILALERQSNTNTNLHLQADSLQKPMSIKLLPDSVINQIAAGEVVERPAHLIKELVENALDAMATEIQVNFTNGGRTVKIVDNGKGMSREDLAMSTHRHATSKIDQTEDLWKLSSFGFRGEALASISAVSKMQIWSGQGADSFLLKSEFGQMQPITETSTKQGTEIIVEDLFVNIPARLKFLKSDTAESTQIKNTLKSLALPNNKVSFFIRQDEKLFAHWPATESLLQRVSQVLEISEKDIYISTVKDSSGYSADLALVPPYKASRSLKQMLTFVRGRAVQDRSLQQAVIEGYRGALMHGEYPIAVVQLNCPTADIDVNVHPTKTQIKFRNPQLAFRVIYKAARDFIQTAPWIEKVSQPKTETLNQQGASTLQSLMNSQLATNFESSYRPHEPKPIFRSYETAPANKLSLTKTWSRLKVLSQAHLTYLVCESDVGIVYVDQHAAHERVLFERLMAHWRKGINLDIQQLLLPITVDLSEDAVESLKSQLPSFSKLGIEIEVVGPQAVAISAYPSILSDSGIVKVLPQVCEDIAQQGVSFSFDRIIDDVFATMACHSAVRAGQNMSIDQMQKLLDQMEEFSESSFCPHGRPVFVEHRLNDIERQFGRII